MKKKRLTSRQRSTLSKHAKHHSPAHMDFMQRLMIRGESFSSAHSKAMKKVGK